MAKSYGLLLVSILFLAGCASNGEIAPGSNPFNEAHAREVEQLGLHPVASADEFFTAEVTGASVPQVSVDETLYQVTIPIDTESPVQCLVFNSEMDAAASLKAILDGMLSELPENQIVKFDAGTFEHLPYIYQETAYRTGNSVGTVKGIVVPVPSASVICVHDEVGYTKTFMRVADSLVSSLKVKGETQGAGKYYEVLIWSLRDMNIGYTISRFDSLRDEEIQASITSSMVLPRTAKETMALDNYQITVEDTTGRLLQGRYVDAHNGEIQHVIDLQRTNKGGYHASGEFQGKAVQSPVEEKNGLMGAYHQSLQLAKAAKSTQQLTLSFDTYAPSASPVKAMPIEAKPTGKRVGEWPEYQLWFSGLKGEGVIDDSGPRDISLSLGSFELQVTRAYKAGKI